MGIAFVSLFLDIVELVEHQEGFLQAFGGLSGHSGIVQQINERADVVAAQHGAQQFGGFCARDQRAFFSAVRHCGQVAGLDLGSIIHTGRDAIRDQVHQRSFFAFGRVFQQLDHLSRLFGRQGQWRNTEGGAFSNVGAVGLQHGYLLLFMNEIWLQPALDMRDMLFI